MPIYLCSLCNVSDNIFNCRYTEDMELEDAIHTAILTLKEGYLFLFVLLLEVTL
jgi:hypothetical protein